MDFEVHDDEDWNQLAERLEDLEIEVGEGDGDEDGDIDRDDVNGENDDSDGEDDDGASSSSSDEESAAGEERPPGTLPEHACAYCGLSVPECVVLCESSGRWFCNTPRGVGVASCVVAHLATSRLRACRLHSASPLGDAPLECYSCGGRNPFVLGFVPLRGEDTVLLLCRDTPATAPGLAGLDVDLGAWAPLVEDRAFVPWLVRPPMDDERREGGSPGSRGRVSVARAAAMEVAWRKERAGEGGAGGAGESDESRPPRPLELEPLRPSYEDGLAFEAALAPCVDAEADEDEAARVATAREGVTISWEAKGGAGGGAGGDGGSERRQRQRQRALARIPLPRDEESGGGDIGNRLIPGDELLLFHATAGGSNGEEAGGGEEGGSWHGVATVLSIGESSGGGGAPPSSYPTALCEVRAVLPPPSPPSPHPTSRQEEGGDEKKREKDDEKKREKDDEKKKRNDGGDDGKAAGGSRPPPGRNRLLPPTRAIPTHVPSGWRVTPAAKTATYDRMRRALALFAREEGSISPYLHARVLGDAAAAALAPYAPAEGARVPKSADAPGLPPLNDSQAAAVLGALSSPLALIQGPPGTGKSVTCASLAYHLATGASARGGGVGRPRPPPILVTAPSNVAVDHLSEKIAATGLRVVRLVARARGESVSPGVEHLTLTSAVAAAAREATAAAGGSGRGGKGASPSTRGMSASSLRSLVELGRALRQRASGPPSAGAAAAPSRSSSSSSRRARDKGGARDKGRRGGKSGDDDGGEGRLASLLRAAERAVLSSADVVCATCAGAGDARLSSLRFPRVMVDEATMATIAEALIPATKGCRQLVLVGDHRQLGPVCASRAAAAAGFGRSLFERFLELGYKTAMLRTQYRMHGALSAFPSDAFYGGGLQNGVARGERESRAASCGVPWPAGPRTPLMFWSVRGREETSSSGTSFLNVAEADAVEAVVTSLLRAGGARPDEVGVISPYSGQIARIRHALATRGPLSRSLYDAVEVSSVDGFQGREKEFIVFSAVRTGGLATTTPEQQQRWQQRQHADFGGLPPPLSGSAAGIGFLADPRRLNVALTRARSGLVLVGSPEPLSRHALWAALLARVSAAGALVEGPLAALRPAEAPLSATRGVDAAWWALSGSERKAARAAQAAAVEAAAREAAAREAAMSSVAAAAAAASQQQHFYDGSLQQHQHQQQHSFYFSADSAAYGGVVPATATNPAFAIGGGTYSHC